MTDRISIRGLAHHSSLQQERCISVGRFALCRRWTTIAIAYLAGFAAGVLGLAAPTWVRWWIGIALVAALLEWLLEVQGLVMYSPPRVVLVTGASIVPIGWLVAGTY